jgi:hypothetical protein
MPLKNAFGTPSDGRAPKAVFRLKLPVSMDSSRSRKLFWFGFFTYVATDGFGFTPVRRNRQGISRIRIFIELPT